MTGWNRLTKADAAAAAQAAQAIPAAPAQGAPRAGREPPWLIQARQHVGVREVPGKGSNPAILGWAKALGGWVAKYYQDDATPWCGLFVSHCVLAALPHEKPPANPLGALAWAEFGRPLAAPTLGAVLVFKRPGGGHVGFYVGETAAAYLVLGGNQGDAVSIAPVAKTRLAATRWPNTWPLPAPISRYVVKDAGPLSKNEA